MTKEELIQRLSALTSNSDLEAAHVAADGLLLQYIDDEAVDEAFAAIEKWYS